MQQVLFKIPGTDIPLYGYGTMLFLAFVFCTWLGTRLARREGVRKELLQDLALWFFVSGILGARITFIIQEWRQFHSFWQFFAIWDGGLVFYGSAFGALIGYFIVYALQLRKYQVSTWKMADIIAPCVALGLCLGRLGCLLNGCCYGNVACPTCPGISFPLAGQPRVAMTQRGYQTAAGFTVDRSGTFVALVEKGSGALAAGLVPGDRIVKVNGVDIGNRHELDATFGQGWPRGQNVLELAVDRGGVLWTIGPFEAWTIPLHPTQIYESISMALLLFFLLSYYPFKKHDGAIMVLFMTGYGVHRFLNEMLRTDTQPVLLGMTFSQNISVVVLAGAAVLAYFVWRRKVEPMPTPRFVGKDV